MRPTLSQNEERSTLGSVSRPKTPSSPPHGRPPLSSGVAGKRGPFPSQVPEELKETATLNRVELDALLDESRQVGEETTNNVPAEEIDRLLEEARSQMRSLAGAEVPAAHEPGSAVITPVVPLPLAAFAQAAPSSPNAVPIPPPQPAPIAAPHDVDLGAPFATPSRTRPIVVGITVAALVALVAIILFSSSDEPDAAAPTAAPSLAPAPATATATAAQSPPSSSPSTSPSASAADAAARAALEMLRVGLDECVRHGIGAIPGTSPPVPATLAATKGDGYVAQSIEWKSPVWSCTKVHIDTPMRFVLQWQSSRPGLEGQGVVWIDADGDGNADRALAFHATKTGKGEIATSPIGPIDPATKIIPR